MKKFLLSIFAVLFAFAGAQAQEVTLDFTKNTWGFPSGSSNKTISSKTYTSGSYSIVLAGGGSGNGHYFNNDGYLINGKSGATLTLPAFDFAVSKIEVVGRSGASASTAQNIYVGTTAVSTETKGSEGTNVYEIAEAYQAAGNVYILKISSKHNAQYTKINIYKAEGGETPDVPVVETVATPVITAESTTFNEGESLFVTIETETEGAEIYYTLDGSDPVENGAPYEGEIELTETTTVKAVAMLDGWNNSAVAEATFTAIDPNGGSFELVASELGVANGVDVKELTFGNVTATFDKGSNSNAPKYYSSGTAIRCYGGNTITFTGAKGVTITGIELTYGSSDGSNKITADCGTFSAKTWTGASNKVVLTVGGTSGNRRIAAIKVTYSVGENVVVIATPSITPSTSFVGSTIVEITNNEEGTTLYYSTNGVNYAAYIEALNITETTTVYAKAVDAEGNESAVAEATYTKIEVLSIAEAKAAYDNAGGDVDVDVAVDLTGAVVTVNSGQYLFIENGTSAINLYNSGAEYAVGTKFTSGYILGKSSQYNKMHQITGAEFKNVETTTVTVEPTEVEIADIKGNNAEWEGRFVKLSGVSINVGDKTIKQGEDTYALYNRFALTLKDAAMCDVEGIVAIYNTTEQLYISKVTPFHTLTVGEAGYATLFLDFAATFPAFEGENGVFAAKVNGNYVDLTKVEDVLPANTGVIVKAAPGEYTFTYTTEEATVDTDLMGTATAEYITPAGTAYVLGKLDGKVALYKAMLTDGKFLNNANKAYLVVANANPAAQYSFRFGEGTTGIENVESAEAVKVIFDLTGRRVEAITAPGIYIVNGKKVLVK